jgi:hypothetical protein
VSRTVRPPASRNSTLPSGLNLGLSFVFRAHDHVFEPRWWSTVRYSSADIPERVIVSAPNAVRRLAPPANRVHASPRASSEVRPRLAQDELNLTPFDVTEERMRPNDRDGSLVVAVACPRAGRRNAGAVPALCVPLRISAAEMAIAATASRASETSRRAVDGATEKRPVCTERPSTCRSPWILAISSPSST